MKFNFLLQTHAVQDLLTVCEESFDALPQQYQEKMKAALEVFEVRAVPTAFSVDDFNDESDLTKTERLDALYHFVRRYDVSETDYARLDQAEASVRAQRVLHLKVEYDARYTGGEYSGMGETTFLPLPEIKALEEHLGFDGAIKALFKNKTGLDPLHIVHYSSDEMYNAYEELIRPQSDTADA
jgi:hypothetical protein